MTQCAIIIFILVVFKSVIDLEVNPGDEWYGEVFFQKKIERNGLLKKISLV